MWISRCKILCFLALIVCGSASEFLSARSRAPRRHANKRHVSKKESARQRKRQSHVAVKVEDEPDYLQHMAVSYQIGSIACLGACCASIFVGPWLTVPLALTGAFCFACCYNSVEQFLEKQLSFTNIVRYGCSAMYEKICSLFS
jgi:hypothetical protein